MGVNVNADSTFSRGNGAETMLCSGQTELWRGGGMWSEGLEGGDEGEEGIIDKGNTIMKMPGVLREQSEFAILLKGSSLDT